MVDERLLNKVFNTAHAEDEADLDTGRKQSQKKQQRTEEDDLRNLDTPLQSKDAIARILLAKEDKDWFR